jgi:hypothetical protein
MGNLKRTGRPSKEVLTEYLREVGDDNTSLFLGDDRRWVRRHGWSIRQPFWESPEPQSESALLNDPVLRLLRSYVRTLVVEIRGLRLFVLVSMIFQSGLTIAALVLLLRALGVW